MLIYRRTSIIESSAQTLVNTVNCVGVMGKGIALEFKKREPEMFAAYKRICDARLLEPGKLWLWRGAHDWVLNFPTKVHWKNPSKIQWIEMGLQKFAEAYEKHGIREISFPRLGCGNGGLDWDEVRPLMERYLSPLPIQIYVHDYTQDIGLPEHMEALATQLRARNTDGSSFEGFMSTLSSAVELGGERLQDVRSHEPFRANLATDAGLQLERNNDSWTFEMEDLRGVWLALQGGLVTKEKAASAAPQSAASLLSLLSVLPDVRPVEIQRQRSHEPELAVELLRDKGSVATPPGGGSTSLNGPETRIH